MALNNEYVFLIFFAFVLMFGIVLIAVYYMYVFTRMYTAYNRQLWIINTVKLEFYAVKSKYIVDFIAKYMFISINAFKVDNAMIVIS